MQHKEQRLNMINVPSDNGSEILKVLSWMECLILTVIMY